MKTITTKIKPGGVGLVEFSPGHRLNPFSGQRMELLREHISWLEKKDEVRSILLYGGDGNSFSAGGDFNETSFFKGGDEVDLWLDRVNELYKSILACSKPVISAIEGYAIGFGLQLAICCDYRIGSDTCIMQMPEFSINIACNFGGYMLDKIMGRGHMQTMIFGCDKMHAHEAYEKGLLGKIVSSSELLDKALDIAEKMGSYQNTPVQETKHTINKQFIEDLEEICKMAKIAQRRSFATGFAQQKMKSILKV
jgi:enoyl-CoA hydratase/carnithine racemase